LCRSGACYAFRREIPHQEHSVTSAIYPSLKDRLVLITGGASGIGADMVRAFCAQGARVAFIDIQDEAAAELAGSCKGAPPVYRHCDITDIAALQAAIGEIIAAHGPVSVLVNNAANDRREPVEGVTAQDWDLAQNINLRPHFFAAQAVHAGMKSLGGGSIINFSSIAWRIGTEEMTPYATAKAAIVGLTRALARAFGPDNIRVNAIEPGAVMTPRQRQLWYPTEESVQVMVERQVIRKVLTGEDIARAALFLASDDSSMITKQSFIVDAGMR
jgi:NAD(P)-dependent dehydrogenase (short-subunit alcohol dehydrogenase family)